MSIVREPDDSIRDALVEAVRERGEGKGLRGADAGFRVRNASPDFSPKAFGAYSLKQYIEKFVPELTVIGYSGLDPVYGLKDWTDQKRQPAPPTAQNTKSKWRVWVSPGSGRVLAVDRDTGEVEVLDSDEPVPADKVCFAPADASYHLEVAKVFLDSRPDIVEPIRSRLQELVTNSDDGWWRPWSSVLKAQHGSIYSDWAAYRSQRLGTKFREALKDAGLEADAINKACCEVQPTLGQRRPGRQVQTGFSSNADDLLQVALRILPTLTEDELRAINLPLGKVYDACTTASRNR